MCCRVLKALYFLNGTFMNVGLGAVSSYVWRRLLVGMKVLEAGVRWRVGDGQMIEIFNHKWLNKPPTFKPHAYGP